MMSTFVTLKLNTSVSTPRFSAFSSQQQVFSGRKRAFFSPPPPLRRASHVRINLHAQTSESPIVVCHSCHAGDGYTGKGTGLFAYTWVTSLISINCVSYVGAQVLYHASDSTQKTKTKKTREISHNAADFAWGRYVIAANVKCVSVGPSTTTSQLYNFAA